MVQGITSANIIKVSARNVTSNKVIPIVAQLAGTRITKTSPSTPRSKPNIIVVHRPTPSKPKFLEIDGRGGKPSSPVISTEGDTGVKSTTAVIKSVPTKLVSVPANVRKISGSTISSAFPKTVHKVIRKRNLQQVVFKPSASVITSPSTFPPTTTTTVPTGFNVIKPGYKSPTPTSQKTVCVPKSIKPLMALKSPGLGSPKVVPYPDFHEPSAPIQIPPFSPSLLHPNPQVLMKKHRQRLVTINTSKDRVTPPSSEEGMRDFQ
uniref:Uncharacterized protein n=1 Tax=Ciona savignyi TaxID=51511 RepID=H2YVZ9_CIOSA